MKAYLLYPGRDFDTEAEPPAQHRELTQDLALDTLVEAMAQGDPFLDSIARKVLLAGLTDPGEIRYRQQVLADCLEQAPVVRELYAIAVDALEAERGIWGSAFRSPESVLFRAGNVMRALAGMLVRLRQATDRYAGGFGSPGFTRLFAMLADELDDAYLADAEEHLRRLRFKQGTLISIGLGPRGKQTGHVLRRPHETGLWDRLTPWNRDSYTFQIAERDMAGARALSGIRDRGVNLVADALAQSADHVRDFFRMLRAELGFYVGCLNLHERLTEAGTPICFPAPVPLGHDVLSADGLYDPCLALNTGGHVVSNDIRADGKRLVMITGANQGGKSTFLRAFGLAQLMAQSGMYVPATSFRASVAGGVFTHFKREEDATLRSGKLDEELARMSDIVDLLTPGGIVLCNESFASTNEREGSQIARETIRALTERGIRVVYVTHLFDLADGFQRQNSPQTLLLRAERLPDGRRTFKLTAAPPEPSSHGVDLYREIFDGDGSVSADGP